MVYTLMLVHAILDKYFNELLLDITTLKNNIFY